jgi:hypothetical protein
MSLFVGKQHILDHFNSEIGALPSGGGLPAGGGWPDNTQGGFADIFSFANKLTPSLQEVAKGSLAEDDDDVAKNAEVKRTGEGSTLEHKEYGTELTSRSSSTLATTTAPVMSNEGKSSSSTLASTVVVPPSLDATGANLGSEGSGDIAEFDLSSIPAPAMGALVVAPAGQYSMFKQPALSINPHIPPAVVQATAAAAHMGSASAATRPSTPVAARKAEPLDLLPAPVLSSVSGMTTRLGAEPGGTSSGPIVRPMLPDKVQNTPQAASAVAIAPKTPAKKAAATVTAASPPRYAAQADVNKVKQAIEKSTHASAAQGAASKVASACTYTVVFDHDGKLIRKFNTLSAAMQTLGVSRSQGATAIVKRAAGSTLHVRDNLLMWVTPDVYDKFEV